MLYMLKRGVYHLSITLINYLVNFVIVIFIVVAYTYFSLKVLYVSHRRHVIYLLQT